MKKQSQYTVAERKSIRGFAPTSALKRLLRKVSKDPITGCWLWQGHTNKNGYGRIRVGSRIGGTERMVVTHLVAYEATRGPVQKGHELDHLCRNRGCCNLDHLEPVTHTVNVRRGARKTAITHCKRGHALEGDNLRSAARKNPKTGAPWVSRSCKACAIELKWARLMAKRGESHGAKERHRG